MGEQRNSLRIVAPASLAAFAVLVVIVLAVSLGGSDDGGSNGSSDQQQTQTKRTVRRSYTVKSGDNLQLISQKTGVPVAQLQSLNPDLDPQALQTGQRIKLR
ncbi:MAG: LysM domain-containing protein [Phycisphaeraceae bacterium]